MRAWASVEVPDLNLVPAQISVFDSASQQLQNLRIADEVTMYVCGITPYDATHMGHASTYVAFDTLLRVWQAAGAGVNYTQNVTDVDDPLIERAKLLSRNWQELAIEQTELFKSDMVALRVIPPANYIGAVESISLVEQQVLKLQENNCVYEVSGDLYYEIGKSKVAGKIAHLSRDQMIEIFSQRGGDPARVGKHDPLDALLWKLEQPDDPSWASVLGKGRPGWHIECAAIAIEYLGETIDVQGGGSDLKFPHHEMSAAHAQSSTGKPFARNFLHTGMVSLDGEKMSKSLGNLVFVSKLIHSGVDPMAIRLNILSHHYRADWEWFDKDLQDAVERLSLWRDAFACESGTADQSQEIFNFLVNDLDTPSAIDAIDSWASRTLISQKDYAQHEDSQDNAAQALDPDSPESMQRTVDALLGIV
jgi:L-cysteine:1D-myo-inositol 2-amino-2-deoxy-alpha-D-glucopyranoside ligase